MAAIVRAAPELPWFTDELQAELIDAGKHGLKTEWVARFCGVAPHALTGILDLGARRDAPENLRSFFMRWTRVRVRLMKELHDQWVEQRDGSAHTLLKELWPEVYGKDAKPDYDVFAKGVSTAEEMEQLEAIIENPYAYGDDIGDLFKKHGRLRADGT